MATDVTQQGLGRSRPQSSDFSGPEPGALQARHGLQRGLAPLDAAESLERGLGWFSIGVGAAAVAAPRVVCWLSGLRSPLLMRLVGTRELTAGIGILTQRDRAPWLWSRVVGNTFDLAAAVALAAVAGVTALDLLAAARLSGSRAGRTAPGVSGRTDIYLERSVAVSKSPEECYRFWRSFEIAIDRFGARLRKASQWADAETLNYEQVDVAGALEVMTGGRGPDACIDAVGMEGHAHGAFGSYDRLKQTLLLESDRPPALRQALMACRNGGTVSIPGVYGGFVDKIPFGAVVNKALTVRSGQTHVQRYLRPLLELIEKGSIDPGFVVTHRMRLEDAPRAYRMFRDKQDSCIKVVLQPWADVPTVEADEVSETGRILH